MNLFEIELEGYIWRVVVFDHPELMWDYYRKQSGQDIRFGAITVALDVILFEDGEEIDRPEILGELLLSADNVGSRVLSHEATHMAFRHWEDETATDYPLKIKSIEDEERVAHLVGEYNRRLVSLCWDNGIYDKFNLSKTNQEFLKQDII